MKILIKLIVVICLMSLSLQISCKKTSLTQITRTISLLVVQIVYIPPLTEGETVATNIVIGSGFIVNDDYYVITAGHLLDTGEQYMAGAQSGGGKLGVVIQPPQGASGTGGQTWNDFDIVARDEEHDLALLKTKMSVATSPFNGETLHLVQFSNGLSGSINLGDAPIIEDIALTMSIGITGYTSENLSPETLTGTVTSGESSALPSSSFTFTTGGTLYIIMGYHRTDMTSNATLTGSPVYSIKTGKIVGMCISRAQNTPDQAGELVVIPGKYILEILGNK